MGRLVHTGLGSSSLVAHVLQYPAPTHANSFVLGPAVINTHTHLAVARPASSSLEEDDVTVKELLLVLLISEEWK